MPESICTVPECPDQVSRGGMCSVHYMRRWRYGDPLAGGPRVLRAATLAERFWVKVDKKGPVPTARPDLGPCWVWTASHVDGYGRFRVHGHTEMAHRWIWEQTVGPIPDHLLLDHLCRNRSCVKALADQHGPAHLEPVTFMENLRRAHALSRRQLPNGEPGS